MNTYKFQFAPSYQGYWNIPTIGNDIPGILYIEKYTIHLDLYWNNYSKVVGKMEFESATGYAYADDENKKECYYFTLNELYCTNASWFGNKQSQFKFDVAYFTLADTPDIVKNNIKSLCIRTKLMDNWIYYYTKDSFDYNFPTDNSDTLKMEYKSKRLLSLYQTENMRIYIYFGYGINAPSPSGYSLTTRSFLNVEFKKSISFDEALDKSEQFIWLFALLWNNMFCPDFVVYRTKDSDFVYKQSNRYSHKYYDGENKLIMSDFSDFSDNQLTAIIDKWIELLENFKEPLNTFFETQFNEHMSPLNIIKNHISALDGLSKDMKGDSNGQIRRGKQQLYLDNILTKIKNGLDVIGLNQDDYNKLKNAALRESSTSLKQRISCLLETIEDYVECDLEHDFCDKIINTRNYYTHPKEKKGQLYSKKDFWDLSLCLEKIISSYILKTIGVEAQTARKIVREITMKKEE